MERVGPTLKELIREGMSEEDMRRVGEDEDTAAAMHDGGLIHDLTTSNILVREDDGGGDHRFRAAHNSIIAEDKGVDLYVLERAVTVTAAAAKLFEGVMSAYKTSSSQWSASFNKFAEVRMRGRKRSMVG